MGASSSKRKGTFDVQKSGKTANGSGVVAQSTDEKNTVQHVVKEGNGGDKGVQEAMLGNGASGRSASLRFIDADGENETQKGDRSHSIPIQLHQSPASLVQPSGTLPKTNPEPPKETVTNGYTAQKEPEVVKMEEKESVVKPVSPVPPVPSPKPGSGEKKLGSPAAPSSHVHAQGDAADLMVTIENIEEVSLSKRGSYVAVGERTTLEVPEYAVSEPDSDLGSRILEMDGHSLTDIHENDEVRELTHAEIAAEEKRRADECPEISRMESPVGFVDEPKTMPTPIIEVKSSAELVRMDKEDEDLISTLQEIEWTHGGDVAFVRGTFSHWAKKIHGTTGQGKFCFHFPDHQGHGVYVQFYRR